MSIARIALGIIFFVLCLFPAKSDLKLINIALFCWTTNLLLNVDNKISNWKMACASQKR